MILLLLFPQLLCADPPFWQAKKNVYDRIKNERAIIVSAKAENGQDGKRTLTFTSAGHIKAPVSHTHQRVMDFYSYKEVLPYVEDIRYDAALKRLKVIIGLFHYYTEMNMTVKEQTSVQGGKIVDFESIAGGFVGLKASIIENPYNLETTEISMHAEYTAKKIPVPDFIINWGLEIAGHRAAKAMRSHIEETYQKNKER